MSSKAAGAKKTKRANVLKSDTARTAREIMADPMDTQWPPHKRILFRPNRTKYILGQAKKRKKDWRKECVFCANLHKGVKESSLVIYKTKHAMVILNKYPYNTGHLLVLPQEHCGDPVLLSRKAYLDVQETVRMCVEIIQKVYQPAGINLGANLGKAAGAGIPEHLHYHVIPRWSGDLNFFQLVAESKTLIETVEQTYARLLPYFRG